MISWKPTTTFLVALLALLVLGCSDDGPSAVDAGTDAGADSDTDTDSDSDGDADEYAEHLIEGGGTTGGPIDGLLVLWYFDDHSGEPIVGRHVMVGDDPETALLGVTGEGGGVVFEDPSLDGPQNVHSYSDGYPASSMYGIDATYATLTPEEAGWEADTPIATIGGAVTGLELIPDPEAGELKFAMVFFGQTLEDIYSGDYPVIEQATEGEIPVNAIIPAASKTTYDLEVYERVGALFVVGGLRNGAAQTFDATHLGVITAFDPADVDGEVDLELSIPLPNTYEIQVDSLDSAYAVIRGLAVLDLGDDGTVSWSGNLVDGPVATLATPDLSSGPLAEAEVMVAAIAQQEHDPDAEDWETYPQGRRNVRDLADLDDNTGTPLLIDDLIAPPADLAWTETGAEVTWPGAMNYGRVSVTDDEQVDVWSGHLWDGALDPVPLPELPADWGWEGLPSAIEVTATNGVVDADLNDVHFEDFGYLIDIAADAMIVFSE